MIYLILMLIAILILIVYGFLKHHSQMYRMGILLLAVWIACAGGYFLFA